MPASMTGYGQGRIETDKWWIKAEVRAVNGRFLEVNVRLPRPFLALEGQVRQLVRQRLARGHVDVFIEIRALGKENRLLLVDSELAIAYYRSLRELAQILEIPVNAGAYELAALPGVLAGQDTTYKTEEAGMLLAQAVQAALDELQQAREREGVSLVQHFSTYLDRLAEVVGQIKTEASGLRLYLQEALEQRVREIAGTTEIDPGRLAQEVLFYAERGDITEEVVRLHSHITQVRATLANTGPVGKRLDFLMQEMHREVNTIGAKAAGHRITSLVVTAKEEIEKMREQVQNME